MPDKTALPTFRWPHSERRNSENPTSRCNSGTSSRENSGLTMRRRASQMIIEMPITQLNKIRETEGVSSLSRETQHFVGITSMHGVLRTYKSEGSTACFWATLLSISGILLLWQIIAILVIYGGKPTVSQVSFLISEDGLLFPKVTICNYNPVRRSYIEKLNETGEFSTRLLSYLLRANTDVQQVYGMAQAKSFEDDEKVLLEYQKTHNFSIEGFFMDAGFSCNDVLKLCYFAGRRFNCCEHSQDVMTSLGKCQMINMQASPFEWMRKQSQAGISSGLQLILDTHIEEQLDVGNESLTEPVYNDLENGFLFYVDDPDLGTYASSQGISLSPGDRIYSALGSNQFILLEKEQWGNCTARWPAGYTGKNTLLKYSSTDCISKCKARFFNNSCGCSPFVYNIDSEYRSCTPLESYKCMQAYVVTNYNETSEEFRWPSCVECSVECERREYIAYNSYGRGFSNGALRWLASHNPEWSQSHISTNFVTVNVFFRDMTYTQYTQVQATSVTQIISNIGGNMGMFLGMSVFTIFEAIIYLTKVTWITFSKKRRQHLADKKKKEQEKEKELEETVKSIRQLSSNHRMHELHDYLNGLPPSFARSTSPSLKTKVRFSNSPDNSMIDSEDERLHELSVPSLLSSDLQQDYPDRRHSFHAVPNTVGHAKSITERKKEHEIQTPDDTSSLR